MIRVYWKRKRSKAKTRILSKGLRWLLSKIQTVKSSWKMMGHRQRRKRSKSKKVRVFALYRYESNLCQFLLFIIEK